MRGKHQARAGCSGQDKADNLCEVMGRGLLYGKAPLHKKKPPQMGGIKFGWRQCETKRKMLSYKRDRR